MSTFHQVVGLWLAPDFSAVERGETEPPYVDHDAVDAAAIADFLTDFNRCGEKVRVRVANDTVDQVTVHFRMIREGAERAACRDFGEEFLAAAKTSRGAVINVRERWATLHSLKERNHAPPPVLLFFIVDGNFESVMLWLQQFKMRLGIKSADPVKLMTGNVSDADHQGHLPKVLSDFIGTTFGIPYKPYCLVDQLASSPLPSWAVMPGSGPLGQSR